MNRQRLWAIERTKHLRAVGTFKWWFRSAWLVSWLWIFELIIVDHRSDWMYLPGVGHVICFTYETVITLRRGRQLSSGYQTSWVYRPSDSYLRSFAYVDEKTGIILGRGNQIQSPSDLNKLKAMARDLRSGRVSRMVVTLPNYAKTTRTFANSGTILIDEDSDFELYLLPKNQSNLELDAVKTLKALRRLDEIL